MGNHIETPVTSGASPAERSPETRLRMLWNLQEGGIARLKDGSAFAAADLKAVTSPTAERSLGCMDERLRCDFKKAGCGVLAGTMDDRRRFLEPICEKFRVKTLISHGGCGAVKLVADVLGLSDTDAYAREQTDELAGRLGLAHRYVAASGMDGEPDLHEGRVVYLVSGTTRFEPKDDETGSLPKGYVIHLDAVSEERFELTLRLPHAIATGPHSYGRRITDSHGSFVYQPVGRMSALECIRQILSPLKGALLLDPVLL